MLRIATICAVLALLPEPPAFAQREAGGRGAAAKRADSARRRGPARPRAATGNAIDRWNRMSPAARRRALEKLPPERQRQIRERVERFNRLPADEQDRLRERYRNFSRLPGHKQILLRRQMRAFNQAPEERRTALTRELEALRGMPEADRDARIQSEEFRSKYSLPEQQMLQDLSENLPIPPQ
jgi:hypothetical protein